MEIEHVFVAHEIDLDYEFGCSLLRFHSLISLPTKHNIRNSKEGGLGLRSFLLRHTSSYSISRVTGSIKSEIQKWIDCEIVGDLSRALRDPMRDEEELVKLLLQFEEKVSLLEFSREFQDLVLRLKVFSFSAHSERKPVQELVNKALRRMPNTDGDKNLFI